MKCLLFDNYDSFTYNLRHMLLELGLEVDVRRNDRIAAVQRIPCQFPPILFQKLHHFLRNRRRQMICGNILPDAERDLTDSLFQCAFCRAVLQRLRQLIELSAYLQIAFAPFAASGE